MTSGEADIGANVLAVRRRNGISAEQLAAQAGLSARVLAGIEAGTVDPTLSILNRVADALGTSVSTLIQQPSSGPIHVTTGAQLGSLWHGPGGGEARLLTTVTVGGPVELWRWTMAPGERYVSQAHPIGVVETLTVVTGRVILSAHGLEQPLEADTTATYDADVTHQYANVDSQFADILMTVHLPASAPGYRPLDAHSEYKP